MKLLRIYDIYVLGTGCRPPHLQLRPGESSASSSVSSMPTSSFDFQPRLAPRGVSFAPATYDYRFSFHKACLSGLLLAAVVLRLAVPVRLPFLVP